jgi:hypothetical protein
MTIVCDRIDDLDSADRVVDGDSVMSRSDSAAIAMAGAAAEARAASVEVSQGARHVLGSQWDNLRRQWVGDAHYK